MSETAGRNQLQEAKLTPGVQQCLSRLLTAYEYSQDLGRNLWDFAVELPILLSTGLTSSDVRWLICSGFVQHARETTRVEDLARTFEKTSKLTLREQSCFVLTDEGIVFARKFGQRPSLISVRRPDELLSDLADVARRTVDEPPASANGAHSIGGDQNGYSANGQTVNGQTGNGQHLSNGRHAAADGREAATTAAASASILNPVWDRDRHELRVGGRLVKVFRLPSPNQEAVLMAFHEEEWPPRIDDPLPPVHEMEPKRRLHDTIKSLNRNQKARLLRFMGDGTGEGVLWEFVDPQGNSARS